MAVVGRRPPQSALPPIVRSRPPATAVVHGPPSISSYQERSAAAAERERLRAEIALLARNLAESRAVAMSLLSERDAERNATVVLRAALARLRSVVERGDRSRIAAQLELERVRAESAVRTTAANEELDAARADAEALRIALARMQAYAERERRAALAATNASLQLVDGAVAARGIDERRRRLADSLGGARATLDVQAPDVSVIIPVYDQVAMTLDCLQSIADTLEDGPTMQIIVVDDASPTESIATALAGVPFVTCIRNGANLGFLRTCNRAAQIATGRYVHFLNNDTLVRPGWLRELVACADGDERIGVAGSKLLFEDGSLQEAGGIIWRDASGWNYGRGSDPQEPKFNYVRDVDYCSGSSLLVRGELLRRLGGFDERYAPAYFEDSDLCFAVRALGYRVVYQPKSEVVHLEGKSSGTSLESGVKRNQVLNAPKFAAKWQAALDAHYVPDSVPGIVAARRLEAPKMLVMIDNYVPEYDKDSGSNKLFNFIKLYMKLGYRVTYVPDNNNRSEPYTTTLQNLGVEVLYHSDGQPDALAALRERLAIANVVWMGRPELGDKYVPIVREYPALPILYDTHDLHYVRIRRELELKGIDDPVKWSEWREARDLELKVVRSVDVAMTVTDIERRMLEEAGMDNVFVMPNVHDSFPRVASYEQTAGLIFIGGYVHGPNVDAAIWLCEEIMPIVWRTHPAIRVTLIGSNVPDEVRRLASNRVQVAGFIPDVTPYFERARLMVAPLRYGAGLKGKVGHAFAYGLPTITTTIGAEGFDLVAGRDAMIADDAEGFAAAIIRAYDDPALWETLSENGARIVKRFSPEATQERLAAAVELGFRRRAAATVAVRA